MSTNGGAPPKGEGVKKYCKILKYVEKQDPELYSVVNDLCLFNLFAIKRDRGVTFLFPSGAFRSKIIDAAFGSEPTTAVQMLRACIITQHVPSTSAFKSGTYTNQLNQVVKVSSATASEAKLDNGATITKDTKFQPLYQNDREAVYSLDGVMPLDSAPAAPQTRQERKQKGGYFAKEQTRQELQAHIKNVVCAMPNGKDALFELSMCFMAFLRKNYKETHYPNWVKLVGCNPHSFLLAANVVDHTLMKEFCEQPTAAAQGLMGDGKGLKAEFDMIEAAEKSDTEFHKFRKDARSTLLKNLNKESVSSSIDSVYSSWAGKFKSECGEGLIECSEFAKCLRSYNEYTALMQSKVVANMGAAEGKRSSVVTCFCTHYVCGNYMITKEVIERQCAPKELLCSLLAQIWHCSWLRYCKDSGSSDGHEKPNVAKPWHHSWGKYTEAQSNLGAAIVPTSS